MYENIFWSFSEIKQDDTDVDVIIIIIINNGILKMSPSASSAAIYFFSPIHYVEWNQEYENGREMANKVWQKIMSTLFKSILSHFMEIHNTILVH